LKHGEMKIMSSDFDGMACRTLMNI